MSYRHYIVKSLYAELWNRAAVLINVGKRCANFMGEGTETRMERFVGKNIDLQAPMLYIGDRIRNKVIIDEWAHDTILNHMVNVHHF